MYQISLKKISTNRDIKFRKNAPLKLECYNYTLLHVQPE